MHPIPACLRLIQINRGGRFPLIAEAALRNRSSSFVLDGEAVLLGVDGRSDFNGPHSRRHDDEVQFYAFDILVSDDEDLRGRCASGCVLTSSVPKNDEGMR